MLPSLAVLQVLFLSPQALDELPAARFGCKVGDARVSQPEAASSTGFPFV